MPLASESIACVVTSPPYNVDIRYPEYGDAIPWEDYRNLAYDSLSEMFRCLVSGGRLWLNVQSVVPIRRGDNSERVNLLGLWSNAAEDVGFKYRDTVAWIQDSFDGSCAWGSWLRPTAPNLRGSWESILCLYKDTWTRKPPLNMGRYRAERVENDVDWTDLVRNVWKFNTRSDKSYPAVFPDELVSRCLRLSTWPGERVLDPFSGSGTTARVATAMGRTGIGVNL